jgi:hypothetical protein
VTEATVEKMALRCVHHDTSEAHDEDRCSWEPVEYAGTICVEWPGGMEGPGRAIPAWKVSFYDDGGTVATVSSATLHASVCGYVWAELTMFAGRDGKPVLHLPEGPAPNSSVLPLGEDGEVIIGTFPFLITGMRVGGQS